MAIEEGKKAPEFTLSDQAGATVALKDFSGQHVILYFYPRDNTPGCTKEAQGFCKLAKKFAALDAVVLGVSPDSAASHQKFIAAYALPYRLLCDPDKTVMTRYGAWGDKVLYGKKVVGVIRSTVWIDREGRVRKHWRRVPKAADHPAHVLEAIGSDA